MIEITSYAPHHFALMTPQAAQEGEAAMTGGLPAGEGWTILADGLPVCCARLLEIWTGRAYACAVLSADAGPHMLAITRAIRSHLDSAPFARIEMVVEKDFAAGRRWALMLGFELETPVALRSFLPSGRDAWIYSRIK